MDDEDKPNLVLDGIAIVMIGLLSGLTGMIWIERAFR